MSLSNYAEGKVLDHLVGKTSFTMPTAYLALSTADPTEDGSGMAEPSGNGYARKATAGGDWNAAGSDGTIENANALAFPVSTGAWSGGSPLTHIAIFDAVSGGNMLASGALDTSRTVDASGITLEFAAGALELTAN